VIATQTVVLVGVAAACGSWIATRWALGVARRREVIAEPNERSSHTAPTPSGGGIGLGLTAVTALAVAGVFLVADVMVLAATVPVAVACWVGWRDDVRPLPPAAKMTLLTLAAGALVGVVRVENVAVPGVGDVGLGALAIPLTLVWLAGFTNAFNFMDGIDGIAGLTAVVSGLIYAVAGAIAGDAATATLGVVTAGSAAGFLPWNFPRARIFMGDAGSLVLGLLLAYTAVVAHDAGVIPFPASVLLLGPFLFDATLTLVRRAARGERLWRAHREHLYQRLARQWGTHLPVTLLYALFAVVCGVLALVYGGHGVMGRLVSLGVPLAAMLAFALRVLEADRRSDGRE